MLTGRYFVELTSAGGCGVLTVIDSLRSTRHVARSADGLTERLLFTLSFDSSGLRTGTIQLLPLLRYWHVGSVHRLLA
jgi:hypothetical protein